jgi:hypothetical protein
MSSQAMLVPPGRFGGVRGFKDVMGKRGRYAAHAEDYVGRFYRLLRKWRAETAFLSSTTEMYSHPAFIEIVLMGNKVVPLIVQELRKRPDLLVGALSRITSENPVSANDRGNVYAMAAAWIEWFNRHKGR